MVSQHRVFTKQWIFDMKQVVFQHLFFSVHRPADAQKTAQTHPCTRFAPVGKNRAPIPLPAPKLAKRFKPARGVKGSLRAPESGSLRAPDHLEHQKSGSLRAPENHTFGVTLGDTGLGHGVRHSNLIIFLAVLQTHALHCSFMISYRWGGVG